MSFSKTEKRSVARQHDWIDERSRALHQAIAEKIRHHPQLLEVPQQNLDRWMKNASDGIKPIFAEWKNMIENWPLEKLLAFLVETSERASQFRQSSPFTGILTPRERDEIFARYEAL